LFPYSELQVTPHELDQEAAGNGMTKVFVGFPYKTPSYAVGEPVIVYRVAREFKLHRSCATSFATITKIDAIKTNGFQVVDCPEFVRRAGNKTIFTTAQLRDFYRTKSNIIMLEMVYNGVFGKGHNVTFAELKQADLFESHPYQIEYSKEEFIGILEMGDTDAKNTIIDQA
jgi:hypothetical protein